MIIGNGDLASVLKDREDLLFFASGVSNSQETRESEYDRERDLLLSQPRSLRLVYFSSIRVFYPEANRYTTHKKEMEQLVKETFPKYTIIRLGNIDWGTNPHTIINFFRNQRKEGEPLQIQDAYRYVIGKEEFLSWMDMIPDWNCEMNLTGRRMKVAEIVKEYVL
jgi:phage pi2 protein 07